MKSIAEIIHNKTFPLEILDSIGNLRYYEHSDNAWWKSKFDHNGNEIYCEYSTGFWAKSKYEDNGCIVYYEDSDGEKV